MAPLFLFKLLEVQEEKLGRLETNMHERSKKVSGFQEKIQRKVMTCTREGNK